MEFEGESARLTSPLEPGAMVGEYRVENKLGEGGMASVFGAIHPLIGKKAAIKVMSPSLSVDGDAIARFILEAQSVCRIGHPNIVDVFSFGHLSDGRSYFVMEWLQGETLYERLWRQHPLPLPDVVNILDQICDALDAAHEKGIVHRDLKPANVFLSSVRGRPDLVKLLDFGVAKLVHQDAQPGRTSRDCVLGTPEYISPEQARGRDVDPRSDLYSLGVMAYEMVLGRLPFLSDNPADAMQMNLCATPPKPRILWPAIPPELEKMLLGLLAKEPDARPSLAEVRATLATLKPTATPALERVAAAPPPRPLRQRRHLVRMGAVVVTFVGMVVIGYRPNHAKPAQAAGHSPTVARSMAVIEPVGANPTSKPLAAPLAAPALLPSTVAAPPVRKARKKNRDENYLLDPFASH